MPFKLTNAPASFQTYINKALIGLVDIICVVYLNDILIYSNNRLFYIEAVRKVSQYLKEFYLYANLKKYKFIITEVEFLSFLIRRTGIRIDPSKVSTVVE